MIYKTIVKSNFNFCNLDLVKVETCLYWMYVDCLFNNINESENARITWNFFMIIKQGRK